MTRDRLLFYCQHSLGLGHLARSLRLAEGLADRFDVLLLNGGRFPAGTRVPAGVAVLNLPPLGQAGADLISRDPAYSVEEACAERRRLILDALDDTTPAVVLIEMYPFGRNKFEFELLPLLDAVAALGDRRPRVVSSLRDILVQRPVGQERHDERAVTRLNASFDAIVMHADPAFATLEDSFHPATPLRVPVHYSGFVAPPAPAPADLPLARLIVSAGGGMVGEPLVRAAVEVHRDLFIRTGLRTTAVAGPFLPAPVWEWLQDQARHSPVLDAVRRVDDLAAEIGRSALSLSQGGYNTTMDLLRAGTPAVVVPYAAGTEDEQTRRTARLADLGALRMLPARELESRERLLELLVAAAASTPAAVPLDLSGAETTARILAAEVAVP
ncbi:MAG TPA: glycosyltransferase [Mycobacteriales bacterium]